jgi:hypothetical protein
LDLSLKPVLQIALGTPVVTCTSDDGSVGSVARELNKQLRREVPTEAKCPGSHAVLTRKIDQMFVVETNDCFSFAVIERNVIEGASSWSLPRHKVLSAENDAEA